MRDVTGMTIEELEAAKTALWRQGQALREQRRAIEAELEARREEAAAAEAAATIEKLLAGLPEGQRSVVIAGATAKADATGTEGD